MIVWRTKVSGRRLVKFKSPPRKVPSWTILKPSQKGTTLKYFEALPERCLPERFKIPPRKAPPSEQPNEDCPRLVIPPKDWIRRARWDQGVIEHSSQIAAPNRVQGSSSGNCILEMLSFQRLSLTKNLPTYCQAQGYFSVTKLHEMKLNRQSYHPLLNEMSSLKLWAR